MRRSEIVSVKTPKQIGPFRVQRRLGRGGMAETFVGVREGPGGYRQTVCVKRILDADRGHPETLRLFHREARVLAALSHRAITRVIDFGHDDRGPWLALELVEGTDLRAMMRRRPPPRALPPSVAVYIASEVAAALAHAHDHSPGPVVHRDVAPANILLGRDGSVKLTDFGLAKNLAERGPKTQLTRGHLRYLAPEVLSGERRDDPRSDLFSLGVILYQCLCGSRPYPSKGLAAALHALTRGELIPLERAAPHLEAELADVVAILLAPRPEGRFRTSRAAARALAERGDLLAGRNGLIAAVHACRLTQAIEPAPASDDTTEPLSSSANLNDRRAHAPPRPPGWARHERGPGVWQAVDPKRMRQGESTEPPTDERRRGESSPAS